MLKLKSILAVSVMATFLVACNSSEQPTSATNQATVTQSVTINHTYAGEIKGNEIKKIAFMANKGQILNVTSLLKNTNAQVVLYGYDDFLEGENYKLPTTGEYELRVVQPRNFARKGATAKYNIDVKLK